MQGVSSSGDLTLNFTPLFTPQMLLQAKGLGSDMATNAWQGVLATPSLHIKRGVIPQNKNICIVEGELILQFDKPFQIELEEGIASLLKALNKFPEITSVNIKSCNFSPNAWRAFVQGLKDSTHINKICFMECGLKNSHIEAFVEGMGDFKKRLKNLGFVGNQFDKSMVTQISKLLPGNENLEHLSFSNCSVDDDLVKIICKGLCLNTKLKILMIMTSHVSDEGAQYLAQVLRQHPSLSTLSLWDNEITNVGAIAIGDALRERGAGHPDVDLGLQRNHIGDKGAKHLARYGNRIVQLGLQGNEHVRTLKVLEKALRGDQLKGLSLVDTGVSGEAVEAFLKSKKSGLIKKRPFEVYVDGDGFSISKSKLEALEGHFKSSDVKVVKVVDSPTKKKINPTMILKQQLEEAKVPTPELLDAVIKMTDISLREEYFEYLLFKVFRIIDIKGDGNCLFASLAYACSDEILKEGEFRKKILYNIEQKLFLFKQHYFYLSQGVGEFDVNERVNLYCKTMRGEAVQNLSVEEMTEFVKVCAKAMREILVDYMLAHNDDYAPFILELDDGTTSLEAYCIQMRSEHPKGRWGGLLEIKAFTDVFKKTVKIYDIAHVNPHDQKKRPIEVVDGHFVTAEQLTYGPEHIANGYVDLHRINQNHYNTLFERSKEDPKANPAAKEDVKNPGKESPKSPKSGVSATGISENAAAAAAASIEWPGKPLNKQGADG